MKWIKGRGPKRYHLPNGQQLSCTVCQNQTFDKRQFKLNTTGMEFLDLAWANRDATCMVCAECGHILWFMF